MENKITIAIDAMGGLDAPSKTLMGLKLFISKNKNNDYFFKIFGDKEIIEKKINELDIPKDNINIIHTSTVVSEKETPLTAIKNSKNSSMWMSIKSQVDENSDISLSAGNTGVLFVISKMLLKTIDGVSKPALAGIWPNRKGISIFLDLGANIDCNEQNLVDFSKMGSALYKALQHDEKPKVSLLNIGSEEIKGTESLKKAFTILKDIENNNEYIFNGYIEGNEIFNGDSNVIITDGFTGNVSLKTAEGTAKFITDGLRDSLMKNLFTKLSLIFSYFSLKKFKEKIDPRKYNGAIFLGLKGPVVKSHGSTDSVGFYHSIDLCYKIVKGNLMSRIKKNLRKSENVG